MVLQDYHVHTTFSDGESTMEEIIIAALERGVTEIGFSDHSYTFFDRSYCMQSRDIPSYFKEAERLKAKYGGKIKILVGVEQDFYSRKSIRNYDYAIGSVHYLKVNGKYYPIDESKDSFVKTVNSVFGGDFYAACAAYFSTVKKFSEKKEVGIVGHFDLIAMFNGGGVLFDENNDRYVAAYKEAATALAGAGKIFEINTSALRKDLRNDAYPAKKIREFIKSIGGKFILSSDSHKKEDLLFGFERLESEL